MQTQIRLLLEEQSDQGLHCLLFHLMKYPKVWPLYLNFRGITEEILTSEYLGTLLWMMISNGQELLQSEPMGNNRYYK